MHYNNLHNLWKNECISVNDSDTIFVATISWQTLEAWRLSIDHFPTSRNGLETICGMTSEPGSM
jgi:hypothetical protein